MRPNPAAGAAVAGTIDTAAFLAQNPSLFRTAPGRAWGSVGFAALWATVAARSAIEGDHADPPTAAMAAALAAASGAMLAVHLRHHITSPRVYAGAALSAVVLGDTLRRLG